MTAGVITAHEFAGGALKERIRAGDIATCSGHADDFRRETTRRVAVLFGALPSPSDWQARGVVDLRQDSGGRWRATIDNDLGYFDHVLPADVAAAAIARGASQ